jgi:hypothetical protein
MDTLDAELWGVCVPVASGRAGVVAPLGMLLDKLKRKARRSCSFGGVLRLIGPAIIAREFEATRSPTKMIRVMRLLRRLSSKGAVAVGMGSLSIGLYLGKYAASAKQIPGEDAKVTKWDW